MNTKKKFLTDVAAIRLSFIFLLVVYHALCIYTGGWESPFKDTIDIPVYNWLGTLIHLSQMEAMVFISGLLLGYKAFIKPETLSFHSCVLKKAKRILLPCLFFGVIYYIMFYDLSAPWYMIILKLFNGCGHLWFLPMLFWCFLLIYIISIPPMSKYGNKKYNIILLLSLLLSVVNPFAIIPFGIGRVGHFFIYFFMGYCIKTQRISLPMVTRKNIMIACLLFIVSFLFFMTIRTYMQSCNSFVEKATRMVLTNICHTTNALSAIYLIYVLANRKSVLAYLSNKPILITLSGYCYGVYIYQQFILNILYYNTQLPLFVSSYWLPWISTAITVALSLILCHYTLKTKLGRFLIG